MNFPMPKATLSLTKGTCDSAGHTGASECLCLAIIPKRYRKVIREDCWGLVRDPPSQPIPHHILCIPYASKHVRILFE